MRLDERRRAERQAISVLLLTYSLWCCYSRTLYGGSDHDTWIGHARVGMRYRNEFQSFRLRIMDHLLIILSFLEGALCRMWYVEGPKVSHMTTSTITGMYLYVPSLGVGGRGPYTFKQCFWCVILNV
jgi:hypothetical protein